MTLLRKHRVYMAFGPVLLAEPLHLETNYIKFESIGAVIRQCLKRIFLLFFFFYYFLPLYTSQAAVAAFQGPAHTAPQPLWHIFVVYTILVYLPSVIHALPFQSLVIALKHVRPSLTMEH